MGDSDVDEGTTALSWPDDKHDAYDVLLADLRAIIAAGRGRAAAHHPSHQAHTMQRDRRRRKEGTRRTAPDAGGPRRGHTDRELGGVSRLVPVLAEEIANVLAQADVALTLESAGALGAALGHYLGRLAQEELCTWTLPWERERACAAARASWAQQEGVAHAEATAERLRLTPKELATARHLGFLTPLVVPSFYAGHLESGGAEYYPADSALTDAQRRLVAEHTLISRLEAARRLGIDPSTFDRLKREHGLRAADRVPGAKGYPILRYRVSAVEELRRYLRRR